MRVRVTKTPMSGTSTVFVTENNIGIYRNSYRYYYYYYYYS